MRFVNVDDFKKEIMKCDADPINEFDLGWDTWGVLSALERVPTADVAPVVHAHWVEETGSFYYGCSACKQYEDYKYLYCPNCGAKMDEEEE